VASEGTGRQAQAAAATCCVTSTSPRRHITRTRSATSFRC
jgi:hypothetical protein